MESPLDLLPLSRSRSHRAHGSFPPIRRPLPNFDFRSILPTFIAAASAAAPGLLSSLFLSLIPTLFPGFFQRQVALGWIIALLGTWCCVARLIVHSLPFAIIIPLNSFVPLEGLDKEGC